MFRCPSEASLVGSVACHDVPSRNGVRCSDPPSNDGQKITGAPHRIGHQVSDLGRLVGVTGFEPATSSSRTATWRPSLVAAAATPTRGFTTAVSADRARFGPSSLERCSIGEVAGSSPWARRRLGRVPAGFWGVRVAGRDPDRRRTRRPRSPRTSPRLVRSSEHSGDLFP